MTETGKILFHAPTDKFHLVVDSDLESGILYRTDNDYESFQEYLLDEDMDYLEGCACNCSCDNCADCYKKHHENGRGTLTVHDMDSGRSVLAVEGVVHLKMKLSDALQYLKSESGKNGERIDAL